MQTNSDPYLVSTVCTSQDQVLFLSRAHDLNDDQKPLTMPLLSYLSVQINRSFRCWFMLFPEMAKMMDTSKSNSMHQSHLTRTRLKDHLNLPLAARMEVVLRKEDWRST